MVAMHVSVLDFTQSEHTPFQQRSFVVVPLPSLHMLLSGFFAYVHVGGSVAAPVLHTPTSKQELLAAGHTYAVPPLQRLLWQASPTVHGLWSSHVCPSVAAEHEPVPNAEARVLFVIFAL